MIANPILVIAVQAILVVGFPLSGPTVALDGASAVGINSGVVQKFLGIPFAQPPYASLFFNILGPILITLDSVGNLRFRLPQPISYPNGTVYDATNYGLSCIQQTVQLPLVSGLAAEASDFLIGSIFGAVFPDAEDCASIQIIIGFAFNCLPL